MPEDRDYVEEGYLKHGMGLDRTDPLWDPYWEQKEDRLSDYEPVAQRRRGLGDKRSPEEREPA